MKRLIITKAMIALILASLLLSQSAPVYAFELKGNDSKGSYTVVDSRQYPIIFIPGMAGSVLETSDGENAWPGSFSEEDFRRLAGQPVSVAAWQMLGWGLPGEIINDEAFKILALKGDGKTPVPPDGKRLYARATVKYGAGDVYGIEGKVLTGDFRAGAIYQGFYQYMEQWGYKLDENPSGKVFFDFPYDFRRDNRLWTQLLDKKVDAVLKQTKSEKVILVGHSMGGLQARLYMKDPKRAAKVAAVIFMGTPHHGAPMAFYSFTEGYNFGNLKLTNERMWEIAGNWEGGYQLLPDYPFILDADNPSKPAVGVEAMINKNWISSREYERYLQKKKAGEKYTIQKGFPNNDFARNSLDFHKELGDSVDKYPGVKYYVIRGTGQETTEYVVAHYERIAGLPEPVIRFTKQMSPEKAGDGTVPLQGSRIQGVDDGFAVESEHGAIPSNAQAQKIFTELRKKINNEDYRNELVDKLSKFTKAGIARATSGDLGKSEGERGVFGILGLLFGGKRDEAKIKLKNELINMGLAAAKHSRVNITITAGKDESGKDKEEHLYLVVEDLQVKDVGTGVIKSATMNVKVNSYRAFEQIVKNPNDYKALAEAYNSKAVTLEGEGLANKFKAKLFEWVNRSFSIGKYIDSQRK